MGFRVYRVISGNYPYDIPAIYAEMCLWYSIPFGKQVLGIPWYTIGISKLHGIITAVIRTKTAVKRTKCTVNVEIRKVFHI